MEILKPDIKPALMKRGLSEPWRTFVQLATILVMVYSVAQLFGVEQYTAFLISLGVTAVALIIAIIVKLTSKKQ